MEVAGADALPRTRSRIWHGGTGGGGEGAGGGLLAVVAADVAAAWSSSSDRITGARRSAADRGLLRGWCVGAIPACACGESGGSVSVSSPSDSGPAVHRRLVVTGVVGGVARPLTRTGMVAAEPLRPAQQRPSSSPSTCPATCLLLTERR